MKVSLIITTYNWKEALELVLFSVKNQSVLPDEVIIADDGSKDDTKELIEKVKINFPTSLIHSWQEDEGFQAAKSRNKAIAKAKYEYIILIDGDMILHKDFIKDHIIFAKKGTYIQGSRTILSKEKSLKTLNAKNILFNVFQKGIKNKFNCLRCIFLAKLFNRYNKKTRGIKTCNMSFFKADCFIANGFNEDFIGWGREDSEFVQRLYNNDTLRQNLKFACVSFHIYHNESSRNMLEVNDKILQDTIDKKLKYCENGINKYLKNGKIE